MEPRAHDEVVEVRGGVDGLEGAIAVDGAPHVLLVPEALLPHGGNGEAVFGEEMVERLALPESVIGGMVDDDAPVGELVEAFGFCECIG